MEQYAVWAPEAPPKAVVQILHGMAEHIGRYERTALALNRAGYLAAGHDHRGHGKDAETLGYFADRDGWDAILEDAHRVSLDLKKKYPGVPLFLLGHSMGSFLAREYALRYGRELDGLILSGTGFYPKGLCAAGRLLAKLSPKKKPAAAVNKIAFAGNNKPFAPGRTGFEWLSRDEKEVDKYVADPLCGFCFTGRAFADFFGGLLALEWGAYLLLDLFYSYEIARTKNWTFFPVEFILYPLFHFAYGTGSLAGLFAQRRFRKRREEKHS